MSCPTLGLGRGLILLEASGSCAKCLPLATANAGWRQCAAAALPKSQTYVGFTLSTVLRCGMRFLEISVVIWSKLCSRLYVLFHSEGFLVLTQEFSLNYFVKFELFSTWISAEFTPTQCSL